MISFFGKAQEPVNPSASIYDISINNIDGDKIDLGTYKGKKILFVNVASECGFTGQYEDLQKLYETYQEKAREIYSTPELRFRNLQIQYPY